VVGGVVGLVKENFIGNAKEYHDTLIRYEISYRLWIVDRIEIRLDFRPPWNTVNRVGRLPLNGLFRYKIEIEPGIEVGILHGGVFAGRVFSEVITCRFTNSP